MNKINYIFECLWGEYCFVCEFDDNNVNYQVDTTIETLSNLQGDLDIQDVKKFNEYIKSAQIEKWDILNDLDIEDHTKWKLHYIKNDEEYNYEGYEGNWPYHYEELIKAILLCDKDAKVLMIKEGE